MKDEFDGIFHLEEVKKLTIHLIADYTVYTYILQKKEEERERKFILNNIIEIEKNLRLCVYIKNLHPQLIGNIFGCSFREFSHFTDRNRNRTFFPQYTCFRYMNSPSVYIGGGVRRRGRTEHKYKYFIRTTHAASQVDEMSE